MGLFDNRKNRQNQMAMNEANVQSAERINQANIDWQKEYFDKTNAYNTPAMQMQRFKAAGLNPHLVYGQGSSGNTSMPTPPALSYAEQKPYLSQGGVDDALNFGMSVAQQYNSMRKQQADIDNVEAQTQVAEAQKSNVDSQTVNNYANSARTIQQKDQSAQLWSNTVAQEEAKLSNLSATGDSIRQQIKSSEIGNRLTEKQIDSVGQQINESVGRVKLLEMQGQTQKLEQEIKQLDINLKKNGIQPSDNLIWRIIGQMMGQNTKENGINSMQELMDRLKTGTYNLWRHQK